MTAYEILAKKRDNKKLNKEEIDFLIQNYVQGKIPDYQMSAFLMAAYISGLDEDETVALTKAMIETGEIIDLSEIPGIKVDKHSTGGVGDKTTLVLAPLVASLGIPVAKMSGRGLGHTGGTLDKMESIPGFDVNMSPSRFVEQVQDIGIAIAGTSDKIVPADKKIYALRDATATVSSISLITSSIVSKKIAGGADCVVFDVKCGSGAFLKNLDEARYLATQMIALLRSLGKPSIAVISNMNQPLGFAVGNSLEVAEAIDVLKGEGPSDLMDLCFELGAHMVILARKASSLEEAKNHLENSISSGEALSKLEELLIAQGASTSCIESPRALPQADFMSEFLAESAGYIVTIDTEAIGNIAVRLGAGRITKDSQLDLAAGLVFHKKIGDHVRAGDILVRMYSNMIDDFKEVEYLLKKAINIGPQMPKTQPLILDTVN